MKSGKICERAARFHHEDGAHPHEHGHEHAHDCAHDCQTCGGCDPMQETVALMQYMVNHNAAHARELEALAKKLGELGNAATNVAYPLSTICLAAASEQVLAAVSEFEKGNVRLAAVLASLK